jgi:predicted Zn-dependent protease with MMP-like domain
MTEAPNMDVVEKLVEWAFGTLPQKVRDLPDFPGIHVAEEPPEAVLKDIHARKNWTKEKEVTGFYSGFHRNEPRYFQSRIAPDLIFIFRGPILRCSKGNLPAEVKQVVWHEVAHWLGHDETEIKELGLSRAFEDIKPNTLELEAAQSGATERLPDSEDGTADQRPRCIKCYSTDVTCRNVERPLKPFGGWLTDPVLVHARVCRCGSCGYEWDDDDDE